MKLSSEILYLQFLIGTVVFQIDVNRGIDALAGNDPFSLSATPGIEFTSVPPYGSSFNLVGRVIDINPRTHKVAVYIFIEGAGWWTKPTFAQPLTSIQSDSIWICDITTGGGDIFATKIHAFLFPNGVSPPTAAGLGCLPASLRTIAIAEAFVQRSARTVTFSGYDWWVKTSRFPVGPGSNFFSDDSQNVWVDGQNQLHLKISQRNGNWYCSEVILKESLGYGKYSFKLASNIGEINENVVLGLFTWDNDACTDFFREIDIEFSRWGIVTDPNAQYVVQPWYRAENRLRWQMPLATKFSTHSFSWRADNIEFVSLRGHDEKAPSDSVVYSWHYSGSSLPMKGSENMRINLWLNNGVPPSDQKEVEIVITRFEYKDTFTSVSERSSFTPLGYSLFQNHPNPFNPSTQLAFELPSAQRVTLKVFDLTGKEIVTLLNNERKAPGVHEVAFDVQQLPSGVYLYRLQAGEFVGTKKMLLVR